jgi:uncharacterized metal-binding protein YceD (DUF177 family)
MELGSEFCRCIKVDAIGTGDSNHLIVANEDERAALMARFGLLSLDTMEAEFDLRRTAGGIQATGTLRAALEQACIASGEPVAAKLEEAIELLFVVAVDTQPSANVELSPEECDTMFYDGRVVDIGEAAAQSLGLGINPYPRSNDAEAKLRAAGVKQEEDVITPSGPFAALSAIKDQLARK